MPKVPEQTEARKAPSRLESSPEKPKKRVLPVLCIILSLLILSGFVFFRLLLKAPASALNPYLAGAKLTQRGGVYSFLLAGQRDGLTDTLMVALLDTGSKSLNVVSIPRDTVTACSRRTPKINSAYLQAGRGEEGVTALLAEVAQLIGYYPDSYVVVDMEAFVLLVDSLGGVAFEVPEDMSLPAEGIDLQKGMQTLDGDHALQLVRYRSYTKSAGVGLNDFGRMEVQQRFLRATAETALSRLSPGLIKELGTIAEEYSQTNLESGQFLWLALYLWRTGTERIRFETLPTLSIRYGDDRVTNNYYEQIDSPAALALINESINPFTSEITAEMVSHRQLS